MQHIVQHMLGPTMEKQLFDSNTHTSTSSSYSSGSYLASSGGLFSAYTYAGGSSHTSRKSNNSNHNAKSDGACLLRMAVSRILRQGLSHRASELTQLTLL